MKKWLVIAPLAAAAGAAAFLISRKAKPESAPAAKPTAAKSAAPAIRNPKTGVYSFASGYKEAKTVEVSLTYDADKCSYEVNSENFLSDTSDSHVGIIYGEDYGIQVEYAAFYQGEDFKTLSAGIAEHYNGFKEVCCNGINGISYFHGNNYCFAFPIDGVSADYVLFNILVMKDGAKDTDYLKLPENSEIKAILNTITISTK